MRGDSSANLPWIMHFSSNKIFLTTWFGKVCSYHACTYVPGPGEKATECSAEMDGMVQVGAAKEEKAKGKLLEAATYAYEKY